MEIYLHLGAHRCANQTLYSYLDHNEVVLVGHEIAVWTPRRTRNGLMRGLMRAPEKITVEDERLGLRSIARMRIELERIERQGRRAVLISDPDLLGDPAENVSQKRLYPLLTERLLRFLPVFEGRPLRVGLTLRSFEDYWTSCLIGELMRGRAIPSMDDLDHLTTQTRHWRHVIGDIAVAFPNAQLMAWPFERFAGRPGDMLQAFLEASLSGLNNQVAWLGRSLPLANINAVLNDGSQAPLTGEITKNRTRWMPFNAEHQRVLRAEYRRDLTWLSGGAQGLARYIDGRQTPAFRPDDREQTHNGARGHCSAQVRGQTDGIEKRMG